MYTLRLTNLETLEMTDNYYYDFDVVTILFNDRLDVLLTVCFKKFRLELLDEDGVCLAYADSNMYGGLLWKLDEEDEDFGDWDWALLKEWTENGISAPIPKPDFDWEEFKGFFEDFADDDDDYEDYDDYADDYSGNTHCDTYGVCGGISCKYYFECHK